MYCLDKCIERGARRMGLQARPYSIAFFGLFFLCAIQQSLSSGFDATQSAVLTVNAAQAGRKIPETLFGIFFEEINYAGAGGIWAELVSNRGFEAGGQNTPSNFDPWSVIGNHTFISVSTDRSSRFINNKIALRMEVLCDTTGPLTCPSDGVGVYNPGYWGMNIEKGKTYRLTMYVRSNEAIDISASLTSSDGLQKLTTTSIKADARSVSNWKKVELMLKPTGTNRASRLQLTTRKKGVVWFDQVSLMPLDTYKGHGFRKDLISMLAGLKPSFIRFPGGCFVEGDRLQNAFQWKKTIGPWEERPGHFNDVWNYWTDDGLGYLEYLQLAEDLGASPIWVFNIGMSHKEEVDISRISPYVQDLLDSIEFARGSPQSKWGSLRAKLGHPKPFQMKYVALGNEDCWKKDYLEHYLKFYKAMKAVYPDIMAISNCDGSTFPLNHPAELYDYHIYTDAKSMFDMTKHFDKAPRNGAKAFVSEYAVTGKDAGTGTLLAALGEAAFLMGLERNSDTVAMASYAPLFVNKNDPKWTWNPDAIPFNTWQNYGTPSYWMQHFFIESNGATLLPSTIQSSYSASLVASAIKDKRNHLKIKIVNFGDAIVNLKISVAGLKHSIGSKGATKTVLTSSNVMNENSFAEPKKVAPVSSKLPNAGPSMNVVLSPYSLTSFDLPLA